MKKLIVLVSLLALFLTGCSNSAGNKENDTSNSVRGETAAKDKGASSSNESNQEVKDSVEKEPKYIDESKYENVDLDLVKLINLSVKYINNGDETAYKGLLSSASPINAMPKVKVHKVELLTIGDITDAQAAVETNFWNEDGIEAMRMFVFKKENNEWRIFDID